MKLFIFFLSLVFLGSFQTETYYIIKVKGDIVNLSTGKTLIQGDSILSTDQLKFIDKNAMALLIGESRGRFKLTYPKEQLKDENELTTDVKTSLTESRKVFFNTRSIITNAAITDLKDFFGEDEFTVVGNSLEVPLNKSEYTDKNVIAKYDKDGQAVDKELVNQDCQMLLSRTNLGVKSRGEVKLYHVDVFKESNEEGKEKVTRLDVNFIDKEVLVDEFKTIMGVYVKKGYTKPQMKSFLMEYFGDFYGNTHLYTLSVMVDELIEKNMTE